jgi:hypothetical protein
MVDELEWQTRKDRVNKRLNALNPPWTIIKYRQGLDTSHLDGQAFISGRVAEELNRLVNGIINEDAQDYL